MKKSRWFVRALCVAAASMVVAHASDPVAVYARVDRVVLEPTADAPDRIQVWGVFSMAKPDDRNDYLAPARGYLYFKLVDSQVAARKEWADLQRVAGTGQIVALGSRYTMEAQLRKASDRPANPDPYVVSIGLTKASGRTQYAPIRALLDYKPD
jgi:hypothetical protein